MCYLKHHPILYSQERQTFSLQHLNQIGVSRCFQTLYTLTLNNHFCIKNPYSIHFIGVLIPTTGDMEFIIFVEGFLV